MYSPDVHEAPHLLSQGGRARGIPSGWNRLRPHRGEGKPGEAGGLHVEHDRPLGGWRSCVERAEEKESLPPERGGDETLPEATSESKAAGSSPPTGEDYLRGHQLSLAQQGGGCEPSRALLLLQARDGGCRK